jgi:hypothetical protein
LLQQIKPATGLTKKDRSGPLSRKEAGFDAGMAILKGANQNISEGDHTNALTRDSAGRDAGMSFPKCWKPKHYGELGVSPAR